MTVIHDNLKTVQDKIQAAARADAHADANEPTLVAVSKRQPDDRIDAALDAGQRCFGENRVQEAQTRWTARRAAYPDLILHLIGALQTNKAADAVALFDVIEVVDRPKLARALSSEMAKQNRQLDCYIQVNTGDEPQKSGISPADVDDFIVQCRDEYGLNIVGLMCIPPADEEPAMHFALLATIAKRNELDKLSMGMSGDYEEAIGFGATSVRVGSALFGARDS
ncbi:YggS family pyridoxal phosphate-dependent enzyme [Candidatus Puniceispirillum sp.]|uniref:YggS family pyridoxal phosphate-dependent enzyme n=1 Tax=Candidatus Puniceispirillum sp. TaxID=2026719 RepID=UPI003F6A2F52